MPEKSNFCEGVYTLVASCSTMCISPLSLCATIKEKKARREKCIKYKIERKGGQSISFPFQSFYVTMHHSME